MTIPDTIAPIFTFSTVIMRLLLAWTEGSLPVKQLKLVQAWAAIHEEELYIAWNQAVRNIPFGKIEPLR